MQSIGAGHTTTDSPAGASLPRNTFLARVVPSVTAPALGYLSERCFLCCCEALTWKRTRHQLVVQRGTGGGAGGAGAARDAAEMAAAGAAAMAAIISRSHLVSKPATPPPPPRPDDAAAVSVGRDDQDGEQLFEFPFMPDLGLRAADVLEPALEDGVAATALGLAITDDQMAQLLASPGCVDDSLAGWLGGWLAS
eukprot:COSAG01_NODE_3453_length_6077_cov_8.916527_1_plen_195_part_00